MQTDHTYKDISQSWLPKVLNTPAFAESGTGKIFGRNSFRKNRSCSYPFRLTQNIGHLWRRVWGCSYMRFPWYRLDLITIRTMKYLTLTSATKAEMEMYINGEIHLIRGPMMLSISKYTFAGKRRANAIEQWNVLLSSSSWLYRIKNSKLSFWWMLIFLCQEISKCRLLDGICIVWEVPILATWKAIEATSYYRHHAQTDCQLSTRYHLLLYRFSKRRSIISSLKG